MLKNIFSLVFFIQFILNAQWIPQNIPSNISILLSIDIENTNGISGGWAFSPTFDVTGRILYTTDFGNQWNNSVIPDTTRAVVYLQMINETTGYAAAAYNYSGLIKENFNEYLNELYTRKEYNKIQYANLGYRGLMETGGFILKTTNGGSSWFIIAAMPDSIRYLYSGYFLNESIGFIIAPSDSTIHIYKTADGGITWNNKLSFPNGSWARHIVFSSENNGVVAGYLLDDSEKGIIAATTDGGENWITQTFPQVYNFTGLSFSSTNNYYAISQTFEVGNIFKSTDAGLTWNQLPFQTNSFFLNGIEFLKQSDAGIIYGTDIQLTFSKIFYIKTLDGGMTWSTPEYIFDQYDYIVYGSKIIDENKTFITGGNLGNTGLILFTSNLGLPVELTSFTGAYLNNSVQLTWSTATELNNRGFEIERSSDKNDWRIIGFREGKGTTTEPQEYYYTDDLYGNDSYKLYYKLKQIDFDGSFEYSDVVEVDITPSEFSLSQNYPNPFNPTTRIKYSIPNVISTEGRNLSVTLKVYDVLGREVATLVNEEKQPGVYEVEFNAAGLASGIYYYQLKSGSHIETKKMIYLK